jgi:hypothetical protein
MLDERPGIVLADEVGMGKTFEALGIAAAFRHRRRHWRSASTATSVPILLRNLKPSG